MELHKLQQLTHLLNFMTTLTMRPYGGKTDLDAIAHLINTCETVDQLEEGTSVTELKQSFDDPSIDKERVRKSHVIGWDATTQGGWYGDSQTGR
ncbi:MAG: hypothetical protein RIM23_04720 [Coleofasciculus sp. G3-WIS-01]|uniref:hypothetical protein n=1 Tax=Coleofasciculus sp. G3-WIS-01 TaxID=3069528 RepID=UPI0032FDEE7F